MRVIGILLQVLSQAAIENPELKLPIHELIAMPINQPVMKRAKTRLFRGSNE